MNYQIGEAGDEIKLSSKVLDIAKRLWAKINRQRAVFFGTWGAFVIMGFIYMQLATPQYQASLLVASTVQDSSSASGLFSTLQAVTGLGSAADDVVTPFQQFTNSFGTIELAQLVDKKYGLKKRIFSGAWDESTKSWHMNRGLTAPLRIAVYYLEGRDPYAPPSDNAVASYINTNVRVSKIGLTGIYKLTYQNKDPQFAKKFLRDVTTELDEWIRMQTTNRVRRYIDYLTDRIKNVQNADVKQSLAQIMMSQEQTLMLASSGLPFAARPLTNIAVTSDPVSPAFRTVMFFSFFFGLFFAWAAISGVDFWRQFQGHPVDGR